MGDIKEKQIPLQITHFIFLYCGCWVKYAVFFTNQCALHSLSSVQVLIRKESVPFTASWSIAGVTGCPSRCRFSMRQGYLAQGHDKKDTLCIQTRYLVCMISAFCREEDEIRGLLGCYAAYIGDSLSTFRDKHLHSTLEDGTYTLSRNVGKELPLYAM